MNQRDKIWRFYQYNLHHELLFCVAYLSRYSEKIIYDDLWSRFLDNFEFVVKKNLRMEFESHE